MPSFDVVSELNMHEVTNAVDQANREVSTRFDFKGTGARYDLKDNVITLHAQVEFQLKQMIEVLRLKLGRRNVDLSCVDVGDPVTAGQSATQAITLKHGIDKEAGKKIQKVLKDSGLKVQAAIQGDQVRVTGKKRDDLQLAIARVKAAEIGIPLQFNNFRD
ncbi:MAG: YajQ family cyclic di-GMP-binding protein [Gammaproteobacteria bacterium]|nr:YajQ family cyclic di-GMP-binding protein [Gammaproteobacteria bacterium]